jgi:hypothetical protein
VPGDITSLELHPKPDPAVIKPGGEVIYSVHGLSKSGNHLDQLGDLAPFTTFNIDRDGSCTGATCTATKLGQHAVTATLDLSDRDVTGKATLRVATTAPNCTPSASDVRTLEVTPGKGATRTQLRITGKVNPALANCLLRIFFGGSNLGDVTVGSDGSVSERRTVPQDTKPGTIPVGLATTGGQVLVERFFQVTAEPTPWPPWERGLPWLLFILLLLLLAVPALLRERARRQRRWVHKHFRAEPHPSADDLTSLDQDSESEPSFSWRLQAHGDAGSQTLKEGD